MASAAVRGEGAQSRHCENLDRTSGRVQVKERFSRGFGFGDFRGKSLSRSCNIYSTHARRLLFCSGLHTVVLAYAQIGQNSSCPHNMQLLLPLSLCTLQQTGALYCFLPIQFTHLPVRLPNILEPRSNFQ